MIRTRAVDVILRVFDPLPGAKLSMCTASSCGRQLPRNGSRRGLDGLANLVNDALDQRRVVAFGHHPDQRFRSRLADDETALALQLSLRRSDALAHAVRLERLGAPAETHVL